MLLKLFVIKRQLVEVVPRATHTVLRWLDLRDLTQHANVLPLVLLIVPSVLPRGFGVCVASFQHVNKLRTVQPKTVALVFEFAEALGALSSFRLSFPVGLAFSFAVHEW